MTMKFEILKENMMDLNPLKSENGSLHLLLNGNNRLTICNKVGSDSYIEVNIDVDSEDEEHISVDSKLFLAIIDKMPLYENDCIEFDTTIVENLLTISCGEAIFSIPYRVEEDSVLYVQPEEAQTISIDGNELKNLIKVASISISTNEIRPALKGIYLEITNGEISATSVDGFRITKKTISVDTTIERKLLLDGRLLSLIVKSLPNGVVDLIVTNNSLGIKYETTRINLQMMSEAFVNYNRLIPQQQARKILINRKKLDATLQRLSITGECLFKFNFSSEKLEIASRSTSCKAKESLNISTDEDFNLNIAFNSKYISDVLKVIETDNVVMELSSSLTPCICYSEGKHDSELFLVLPVRTN